MYRSHHCGELRKEQANKEVSLAGWVHSIRTHGSLTFIDLRDRYGITQVTYDKPFTATKESVIQIKGKVIIKPQPNKKLATGDIEIAAKEIVLLNKADPLPIDSNAVDEMRLKYRYLDIRNNNVLENLKFRSQIVMSAREFCDKEGFLEIETPLMVKSTPEGARDYVIPSRVNKGSFYALPQSPQLYKQILMIAGADKYFQIARCLRDEDLRADRQPEHTQLDFEMSFVHQEDIQSFVENLMKHVFKKNLNVELDPFLVFSYDEAMKRYGSDKPDIRFDLELQDITSVVNESEFTVFKEAQTVNSIFVEKEFSRKQIDKLTKVAKTYKAKGLAFFKLDKGVADAGITKFLSQKEITSIIEAHNAKGKTGTLFFVADKLRVSQTAMGQVRLALAADLELLNLKEFKFCWVNDFPLFSYNEEEDKWEPEHHMFSMPKAEFVDDFEKRPGEVKGDLWDLVLNGWEMASGSIRISNPSVQERVMNFIGIDKEEAKIKFGFLLEAYKFGGPVHGGMGIGLDRLISLMLGITDIREVIAFPKNKNAQCPMDESPSPISDVQLDELGITLKK